MSVNVLLSPVSASWWATETWPWISDWVGTAGFAALVATTGVSITLRLSARKDRHEIWWEQAEWALARYFNRNLDDEEREAAGRVVRVLLASPLATSAEVDFLGAATQMLQVEGDLPHDAAGGVMAGSVEHNGDLPEEGEQ